MEGMTDKQLRLACLKLIEKPNGTYNVCDAIIAASMLVSYVETGMMPVCGFQRKSVKEAVNEVYKILEERKDSSGDLGEGNNAETESVESGKIRNSFLNQLRILGKGPIFSRRLRTIFSDEEY